MKKIILIAFLSILTPTLSWGAKSCPADATIENCSTNKGCYWNTTNNKCELCPAGTYNDGGETNKTSCSSCDQNGSIKLGYRVSWDRNVTGQETTNCQWEAACQSGEYLNHWKGSIMNNGCQPCSYEINYIKQNFYGPNRNLTYYGSVNNSSYFIAGTSTHNNGSNIKLSLVPEQGELSNYYKFCHECGDNTTGVTNDNGNFIDCKCSQDYHYGDSWNTGQEYNNLQNTDWDAIFKNWDKYLACPSNKNDQNCTSDKPYVITPKNCTKNTCTLTLEHPDNTEIYSIEYEVYQEDANDSNPTEYNQTIRIVNIPLEKTEINAGHNEYKYHCAGVSLPDSKYDTGDSKLHADWDPAHDKFIRSGYNLTHWQWNDIKYGPFWYFPGGVNTANQAYESATLTPHWQETKFTISYVNADPAPDSPTECSSSSKCKAPKAAKEGYYLDGWECTIGEQNDEQKTPCTQEIVKPGDDITAISNFKNMTLTAIWEECPAGYYCPLHANGEKLPCPAGATSDGTTSDLDAKTTIEDCYLLGGKTQITGNNGTFKLPEGKKLWLAW